MLKLYKSVDLNYCNASNAFIEHLIIWVMHMKILMNIIQIKTQDIDYI